MSDPCLTLKEITKDDPALDLTAGIVSNWTPVDPSKVQLLAATTTLSGVVAAKPTTSFIALRAKCVSNNILDTP